ncbi:MAG: hypothetical protein ABI678_03720 [Kofleriaceae bacterium]
MSLRLWPIAPIIALVLAFASGCGGGAAEGDEPQTAREKQYAEAKKNGELDETPTKKGGWRFKGDRKDCRYLVGSKCFKSQANACKAAGCGASCAFTGAGPATVSCKK